MFKSGYFVLSSGGIEVDYEGEKFKVTAPKYISNIVCYVFEESEYYTQLALTGCGIVMVTKVDKEGNLYKTTREYYAKNGQLRPLMYKNKLKKLKEFYEFYFKVKMDESGFSFIKKIEKHI